MMYESQAGRVHVELDGPEGAPAVAFTHGGGLTGAMFDAQVAELASQYRTLTWDLPGHGRSEPLERKLDVPLVADGLVDVMDQVGLDEAVHVGQSLGSYVVQHAAIRHPDRVRAIASVGGLPIAEPMGRLELLAFRALTALSALLPERLIFARAASEKTVTDEAQQFFLESLEAMGKQQFLRMLGGQLDACAIQVDHPPAQPLLITHGEHEMPASLGAGNLAWHRAVPGSRYVEVPDAGHNANMDNPVAFNETLVAFVRDVFERSEHESAA